MKMGMIDAIRDCPELEAIMRLNEAAELIEDLTFALGQYGDDLRYPPAKDSIPRRIEMVESLLKRV